MAINEERSYTEYNVEVPTTDFPIGFDILDDGIDVVAVTLNDVDPTTLGYTVIQVNNTTYRFAPAVPSGVVRLTRITDIDQMAHVFTEGAIFISENMDGNFKQIRHAQQEVRDEFNKLSTDTSEIINTLQVVGEAAQILDGGRYPLTTVRDQVGGVDTRCWFAVPAEIADTPVMNVRDCHRQQDLCSVLWDMYAVETALAIANFNLKFPGYTVTAVANSNAITPGSLIAVSATQTVVIIPGTTNAWQWASQAGWGAVGIQTYAEYSTLQTWYDAAYRIIDRIEAAGADPALPVVLCGHSYGAAVACIIAAVYHLAQPARTVGVLTFGCPKPGDARLARIVSECVAVHLVNQDDPVCYLPPSGGELALFAHLVPPAVATRWTSWVRPVGLIQQAPNGVRTDSPSVRSIWQAMALVVADLVAGNVPPETSAHWIGEYYARIRCPGNPNPSPEPPVLQTIGLLPDDLADLADGDPITSWRDSSGYIDHWETQALPQQAVKWTVGGMPVALLSRVSQLVPSDGLLVPHAADLPSTGSTIIMAMARSTLLTPAGVAISGGGPFPHSIAFGRHLGDVRWQRTTTIVDVADPGIDDVIGVYALRNGTDRQQIWHNGILLSDTTQSDNGQFRVGNLGSWPPLASQVRTSFLGECRKWESYLEDLTFLTLYAESLVRWGIMPPW